MYYNGEIKAVLFDLDDTLVNSKKAEYDAICELKKMYSEFDKVKDDEFAQIWNNITLEIYEEYLKGKISFEKSRMKRMQGLFGNYLINISEAEAKNKFRDYRKIYEANWNLFNDAEEVLKNLKSKYKLVIISNGNGKQQRRKIEHTGLNKYFSNIVISSEVGCSKPEKEIFDIACQMVDSEPKNCVMIGDKYKVDIEGSLNAGMQGIWVNREKENSSYEYQIKELKELKKYL